MWASGERSHMIYEEADEQPRQEEPEAPKGQTEPKSESMQEQRCASSSEKPDNKPWWREGLEKKELRRERKPPKHYQDNTRWRAPAPGGAPEDEIMDRIMQAIEYDVIHGPASHKARPYHGKDWLSEEWNTSLKFFGMLRDNYTTEDGRPYRSGFRTGLLRALPQELLDYKPELAVPDASEDAIYRGLWGLLSKHQGEAWLVC